MTHTLAHFRDKRLVTIFCFGIASGFPWILIGSALSAWLKDEGLSRSAIGLFGLIFSVYSVNFLWSPFIDKIVLPFVGRLGRRRSWIVSMQALICCCCLLIATLDLSSQLYWLAFLGLCIAIFSATQDIAIDAYRIDIIGGDKEAMAASSSMATAGWWTGYGGLGAIPFFIADLPGWGWQTVYVVLGIMVAVLMAFTLISPEPTSSQTTVFQASKRTSTLSNWLFDTLIMPFKEFFTRNGVSVALTLLLFIFSFKIGEAFLGRMSIVFYKEIGFSNSEIGAYSKLINWWVTIVFAVIGGAFTIRFGIYRGLMVAGIAMAASNLMFAWMAQVGPDPSLFIATVIVDGFTAAWSTVAMVAFISLLCNHTFSATQYALMASLSVLGRTVLAGTSGIMVDALDGNWSVFFVITAIMVIPALILLRHLRSRVAVLAD
ncbi:MFS transporter [Alteromonas sediminis]|uniref:MFS transporter n=1 Tax=Alteromonas sediminis TaxID=2259342 RepID=A0A3N5Y0R6_9ALTE|nr:MFS transporter [Alteromonas sediminis]